ncbi:lipopolysaccharide biosynthesis protein [Rhizobium sp. L80/93]|uniref:lipopolysaccharide biosynthesis protein n=1 Tax=Rhizobium sp. E27B/91 TaxID=2819995 RepID=UPI001ADA0352|nr:lipopolysaccharide biosynthesis protein [Rhizobium sp. E27B/91]MBO9188055.1 lipopolysaccharide biosynthesis protein [Rhizobium sp. E27B/91]
MVKEVSSNEYSAPKDGRARAAVTGAIWSSVSSAVPAVVGLLVFAITSRSLTPSEFGVVAFATSVATLLSGLVPTGLGDAIVQRREITKAHLDAAFLFCTTIAAILYLGLFFSAGYIAEWFGDERLPVLLYVLGIRVIFEAFTAIPSALLSRSMNFKRVAIRTITASLGSALLCVVLIYYGYGIWGLVASQLMSFAVNCGTNWMSVDWKPSIGFRRKAIQDLLRYGGLSSASRLVNLVSIDQLAVGGALGANSLGLYNFAKRLYQMLADTINGALGPVSYSLLSSLQLEKSKVARAFMVSNFLSSTLIFPVFGGLAIVSPVAVPLIFGQQWIFAVQPLQAFCLIGLLSGLTALQGTLLRSQGYPGVFLTYQLLDQVSAVVVVYIFYKRGLTPLAVALSLRTLIFWPLLTFASLRISKVSLGAYLSHLALPALGTIVMIVVLSFAKTTFTFPETYLALVMNVLAGGVVYMIVMLAFGRSKIISVLSDVRSRR